jgi:tryptophan synthase alpha chain
MQNKIMGHFVLGYPNIERSIEIALEYVKQGINLLECQFPFSDPSADGTIISEANIHAAKYPTDELFDALLSISKQTNVPITLMSYITRIHAIGFDLFFSKCSKMGITEFIIPDIPYDEAIRIGLIEKMSEFSCKLIPVISTNTNIQRVKDMDTFSFPFYYLMSYYGTTGADIDLNEQLKRFVQDVKSFSKKDIGIGFGIKNNAQVSAISAFADFSIVGSELLRQSKTNQLLGEYIQELTLSK